MYLLEEQAELLTAEGKTSLVLPQDILATILPTVFNPSILDSLMFTSSTMRRLINPFHSIEQQGGPCIEKLLIVIHQGPEDHGHLQQHKVAMENSMQRSPFNSPLYRGAGALYSLRSTPEAAVFQLTDKSYV